MGRLTEEAGYPAAELSTYIQPVVQGTSCHCEFNLFYDPENAAEVKKIRELSAAAVKALAAGGAGFSRPYGDNADFIMNRDAATVTALHRMKTVFDPNYIMNPGKICF
jgi:FAD/FMN-containing dehydrogenase